MTGLIVGMVSVALAVLVQAVSIGYWAGKISQKLQDVERRLFRLECLINSSNKEVLK